MTAMTLQNTRGTPEHDEIVRQLTAPGAMFELENAIVNGAPVRLWKNSPVTLRNVLERSRSFGDKEFIVFGGERMSYAEHFRKCGQIARQLRKIGIGKGDRVAIAMRNLPEWSVAFWAVLSLGAIAVSINALMTGPEMEYCISDSGASVLFADEDRIARLAPHLDALKLKAVVAIRCSPQTRTDIVTWQSWIDADSRDGVPDGLPEAAIGPDDGATILYTSGTTGRPKGALGTHRAACNNLFAGRFIHALAAMQKGASAETAFDDDETRADLVPLPFFHGAGCHGCLIGGLFAGAKLVVMPKWDAEEALRLMEKERITRFAGVPAYFVQLLAILEKAPRDLSFVRTVRWGAAPPPRQLVAQLKSHFPNAIFGTGYGQTESTQIVTQHAGEDYESNPDSCGRLVPSLDVRIVDDEGKDLPVGEVGEMWMRGATVALEYWKKPKETLETFGGGWLRTGDLMKVDRNGFYYVVDRKKDMVIRGGENVYSIEVEQALRTFPKVLDVAVFGLPDPVLGEQVAAAITVGDPADCDPKEIQKYLSGRLAAFKIPAKFAIGTEPFPRNAAGKVLKRELRERMIKAIEAESRVGT